VHNDWVCLVSINIFEFITEITIHFHLDVTFARDGNAVACLTFERCRGLGLCKLLTLRTATTLQMHLLRNLKCANCFWSVFDNFTKKTKISHVTRRSLILSKALLSCRKSHGASFSPVCCHRL